MILPFRKFLEIINNIEQINLVSHRDNIKIYEFDIRNVQLIIKSYPDSWIVDGQFAVYFDKNEVTIDASYSYDAITHIQTTKTLSIDKEYDFSLKIINTVQIL